MYIYIQNKQIFDIHISLRQITSPNFYVPNNTMNIFENMRGSYGTNLYEMTGHLGTLYSWKKLIS